MKNLKRLISFVVALMMVVSLSAVAFASPADPAPDPTPEPTQYTITVTGTADTQNFKAVKIFDMTYELNNADPQGVAAVSYTIASPWADFFKAGAPGAAYIVATNSGTLNPIIVQKSLLTGVETDTQNVTAFINITEENAAAFAEAARAWVEQNASLTFTTVEKAGEDGETVINVTAKGAGYWMVYETSGDLYPVEGQATTVILTSTAPAAEVAIKGEPNVPVKILDLDNFEDEVGTHIGDVLPFAVYAKLASSEGHTYHYQVFEDTMTEGLTFDSESMSIKVGSTTLTIGTAEGSQIRELADLSDKTEFGTYGAIKFLDNGFKLILNTKALNDSTNPVFGRGAQIVLKYTATVNSEAVDLQNNDLNYGNNGSNDSEWEPDTDIELEPVAKVYTWLNSISVDKIIGEPVESTPDPNGDYSVDPFVPETTNAKLAGVGFILIRTKVVGVKITEAVQSYSSLDPLTAADELAASNTVIWELIGKGKIVSSSNVVTEYYKIKNGTTVVYIKVEETPTHYELDKFELNPVQYCKLTFEDPQDPTSAVTAIEWVTDANQATELFTNANGALTFPSLEDGTYYLRETTTPAGYNALAGDVGPIDCYHTYNNGVPVPVNHVEQISNNTGSLLPETGGIGTTIFYVLGGILLVGASVLLVTRRRMKAES